MILATLIGLIFANFGSDFLDSEVGLATKSSDPSVGGAKASSPPPLLAKVLPPVKKPAVSSRQNEVNFDIVKPTTSPESDLAPVGKDFFTNQTSGSGEEAEAGPLLKLAISEVLFDTKNSSKEEFVELYNPNNFAVELSKWELRKKTENGNDSVLVSSQKFSGAIQPKSYFLISHPDFSEKFGADLAWSSKSYSISENNAIYLLDDFGRQIDLVGCGPAFDYENAACVAPETGVSVSRPDNSDTDNNQKDFSFSKPTPKQSFVAYVYPSTEAPSSPQQAPPDSTGSPQATPTILITPSPTPSPSPEPEASPQTSLTPELPSPEPSPELLSLQIVGVQFDSGEDSLNADFVKIFNPNSSVVVLKGYKLVKKVTSSGNEYNLNYEWTEVDQAPANSDFYWVSSKYPEKIEELRNQGLTVFERDITITATNQIILKYLNKQVDVW